MFSSFLSKFSFVVQTNYFLSNTFILFSIESKTMTSENYKFKNKNKNYII